MTTECVHRLSGEARRGVAGSSGEMVLHSGERAR